MAGKKKLLKKEYESLASFRYTLRKFMCFSEKAAIAVGATPQQHQALLAVKGYPGRESVTIGELAERLQLRHHSVVGLIDRLVIEKLVRRLPSKQDRRKVVIELTAQGEKILEDLTNLHREELKRISTEIGHFLKTLN